MNKRQVANITKITDFKRHPLFVGFRGVSEEDFKKIQKNKWTVLPSVDLMPFDNEVIEYSMGEDYSEASEDEIENYIKAVCDWYDGSLNSVKSGVNITTDCQNAEGYGEIVLAIISDGEYADFSESHRFLKDYKDAKVIGYLNDNKVYVTNIWFK